MKVCNKQEVNFYFPNLSRAFEKSNYTANRICNAYGTETIPAYTTVKTVLATGQRRGRVITREERAQLVTLLCSMSAAEE